MSAVSSTSPQRSAAAQPSKPFRIGSVSFLNARPLIAGLDEDSRVKLSLEVPSRLLDGLRQRRYETALLPVIDYQRLEGLTIIPAGGIGSDGETLTVRVFSRVPIERISRVACDTDSHTSVALVKAILVERYGLSPQFSDLSEAHDAETMLLIGDKVVCEAPVGYPHQLDLGEAWKTLTGLPFVFAVWTTQHTTDLHGLYETLHAAHSRGMQRIEAIVREFAIPLGWPAALARKYLTEHLTFDVGKREIEAIRLFHHKAYAHGVLNTSPRSLAVFESE